MEFSDSFALIKRHVSTRGAGGEDKEEGEERKSPPVLHRILPCDVSTRLGVSPQVSMQLSRGQLLSASEDVPKSLLTLTLSLLLSFVSACPS